MKKLCILLLTFVMTVTCVLTLSLSALADSLEDYWDENDVSYMSESEIQTTTKFITFTIGKDSYDDDGVTCAMPVSPYIKDGRTYLPVRYVTEAIGVEVAWDGATSTVTFMRDDIKVQLVIGSRVITVNGVQTTMDVAPEITSERTCIPIRYVAEAFLADVVWDSGAQTVTVIAE